MRTDGLKRQRQVSIGPVDLTVAVPAALAERLRHRLLYRKVIAPAARRLEWRRQTDGEGAPVTALPEPVDPGDLDDAGREISRRISGIDWYHTIDLGHGVVTPGFVDHRGQLPLYGLPESLAGLRCLDVATYDGFWAFEFERRGAAEVVATDIARWGDCDLPRILVDSADELGLDRPTGGAFAVAHEILGSKVQRVVSSIYDLTPERVGTFDLVFLSDLLVHLRDPQLALERVFSVCRGEIILADVYSPALEDFGDLALAEFDPMFEMWWLPNIATLKKMLSLAGFEPQEEVSRFRLQTHLEDPIHKAVLRGHVPEQVSWKEEFLKGVRAVRDGGQRIGPS